MTKINDLEKQLSQRLGLKKIIERFIEKLAEAKEEDDMLQYETTVEALQNKVCSLQSLNEKILSLTDAESTPDEMLESEEYTFDLEVKLRKCRQYLLQKSTIKDAEVVPTQRCEAQPQDTQSRNENSSNSSRQPFPVPSNSNTQFSKLPKLTLPKFDGDLLQWQPFWDSFDSSIHSNINLTDVQKFGYLKAQLEGTAAMIVQGFALTNANFMRAVDFLRERYGQQSKIIHATMQALLTLQPPNSTVSSLRFFYDRMETYIRGLESLGQNQDMYGSLLVPVVIDKLPANIRKNLARVNENNDWMLQDLRRAINKEINILEIGSGSLKSIPKAEAHNPTALFHASTRGKGVSSTTENNYSDSKTRKFAHKCAFCQKNHHSNECKSYPDMNSRLDVLKEKQLCFNCLGKHHLKQCKSRRTCRFCDKRHNTSICSKNAVFQRYSTSRPEAAI